MNANKEILFSWRLKKSYLTSIVSISLVLFLVGLLGFLVLNAKHLSDYVKENIGFAVILNDNTKESDILSLQKILDASAFSKSTRFVTKEQAAKELQQDLGEDFVDFLGYNPLLSSIEVQLKAQYANLDSIKGIENQLKKYTQIKEVYYQRNLVHLVNENVRRISLFILIFGMMLFIISIALINNTIRLSVYSKRFIINTMKLVGATENFIRRPFLITSALHGLIGAVLANSLLMLVIHLINKEMERIINLQYIGILFVIIIFLGMGINTISTYFSVNHYLKIDIDELYL